MVRRFFILLMMISLIVPVVVAQDQPPGNVNVVGSNTPASSAAIEFEMMIDAREDLELLSVTLFGPNRLDGWNGSTDVTNPQLALLIRLDLELLAGTALGAENRPKDWFGAVRSTSYNLVRDIRHDLEILADAALGMGQRPVGWIGTTDPMIKCNRATQVLVPLLQRGGVFTLTADPNSPTYCYEAEMLASQFAELSLLTIPGDNPFISTEFLPKPEGSEFVKTDFAVAFLDKNASLRVGVVPNGTEVYPVARSVSQFSKMVLFEGEGFAVFFDYRDSTMSPDLFGTLPDSDSAGIEPYCGADWCGAG